MTADVRQAANRVLHNNLYSSKQGWGWADMGLVPAVPTAAAVAAALRPHLQGTQLRLTLTVSNVQ